MTTASLTSLASVDPQLLKLLTRHHQHLQQSTAKDFFHQALYYNHPPPNRVATHLPRHLLGNGLSKLNTENSVSTLKSSSIHGKVDSQRPSNDSSIKKLSTEATTFDQWLQPPIGSIIQGPPCLPADTSAAGLKSESILSSGERITCFIVGGEKRLCLPEILNTVLKDFSLQEINTACERLHIYCSRCTNEQLDVLKIMQVLPINAPSCGLITQTDAERLCANLLQLRYKGQLRSVNSLSINQYERLYSIKVQHKCFGRCSGTLYPTLYVAPQAECIQCDTCEALFSPKTFVSHGHKSEENRVCHWGFSSEHWRAYLKARSAEDSKAREELELVKERFLHNNTIVGVSNHHKKRLSQHIDCSTPTEKRTKTLPTSSSDHWPSIKFHFQSQTAFSTVNRDNIQSRNNSFSSSPPRAGLVPSSLSIETGRSFQSSPLRVARSNSPESNGSTNSSITNFNDFSADGIRQIVESTISSSRGQHQLLTYIAQLQSAAQAQSSRANFVPSEMEQEEKALLRRENELLRERLSKLVSFRVPSKSSTNSKTSPNDHQPQQQDSNIGDADDLESTISSSSRSSLMAHEFVVSEQPRYFDRKRRLLAAKQQTSTPETELSVWRKSSGHKKACLDEIVDSLNQKAQAEQEENNDEEDEPEEIVVSAKDDSTSLLTIEEEEDENIDVNDETVAQNDP